MSQSDRMRRSSENSKSPKTQTSPTFEQLLHGEDLLWSSSSSPTLGNNHDQEEYSNHPNKKSVLAKVKERAKKLRHSLSGKKKHENDLHDDKTTPSWGVSLDDLDEEDDDPEYLGAPMYESELAPETYREYARQHPRASPVVSEKHIMPGSVKHETDQQENDRAMSRNKTMARSASLKLAPSHSVTSKFAGLTVKTPETQETGDHTALSDSAIHLGDMKKLGESSLIGKQFSSSPQKWDKGVSVKEYFLNKLEPGEDERALSQAITDAISPRKTARETGVVEMVKEAVTSFFRHEETSSSVTTKTTTNSSSTLLVSPKPTFNKENSLSSTNSPTSKLSFYASANSSPVPISTNAHPVPEEENHGRILQPN
ncbi:Hypothetical predicted protein [Olea europaea subsp. europaea]|uniref:Low-temperature-induced protein n=1 Tax=Olea europaea subsp. europaea TaxID=158383 RepID=A0A8S0V1W3_OLEEU|nr:Hypothetical predicted protein [Olea europaea subsp. europaea]